MLPQYLKVCLLYTSAFPKDYEIRRNKLIQLWLSESLVEQQICGTFEVIAAEYLPKLIHQSVVLSNKPSSIDMEAAKTCRLHFIFRSLSVNEAESEKFFHVIKSYADSFLATSGFASTITLYLLSNKCANGWSRFRMHVHFSVSVRSSNIQ